MLVRPWAGRRWCHARWCSSVPPHPQLSVHVIHAAVLLQRVARRVPLAAHLRSAAQGVSWAATGQSGAQVDGWRIALLPFTPLGRGVP